MTASGVIIAECMRFKNQPCKFNGVTKEANCGNNIVGVTTGK